MVCQECGVDVREGSAFCYNCGESVVQEPAPPAILRPDPELLKPGEGKRAADATPASEAPAEGQEARDKAPAKREAFPAATRERRKTRPRMRKVPEVEWVESTSWSMGFLIAAIVLTLIAAILAAAALYLG